MTPESAKFIALWKASGWKPAELARQLHTTTASVSRWLNGKVEVERSWVDLLEHKVRDSQPGALVTMAASEDALSEWERKVIEDLRWLHREDRERVIAVMRTMVRDLPKRTPLNYGDRTSTRELDRAGSDSAGTKKEKPKPNLPLTDGEQAAAKGFVETYDAGAGSGGKRLSPRSRGAGGQHPRKVQRPRPSSKEAKVPPAGPSGKDQT